MTVKMRLARFGAKRKPHYRIVVADSRAPRDGRYVEQVGTYNPHMENAAEKVDLKTDRIKQWLDQGVQPTQTVLSILQNEGVIVSAGKQPAPKADAPEAVPGE